MIFVEKLSFTYPGAEAPTLKNISFRVEEGEIFGFLGPSGAGKSTTQKVLNGLLRDYRGKVEVGGRNMRGVDRSFYEDIGVAFEFPNLYLKLSALENLELFASFYKTGTRDPLELLTLMKLEEDAHTKVGAFSKGMKMRLNFARALINRPRILFLDEPTAGLDPSNARNMKDIILDLQKGGTTVFLTTHHMADAQELCRRIAFMVDGQLPVIDSTENLQLEHGHKTVQMSYLEDGNMEHREFPLSDIKSNTFTMILRDKDIQTLHTQEANLEEIFIKVTGQTLRKE